MKQTLRKIAGNRGFTMIEVISVLVIIGIVAAVVVVRMTSPRIYDLDSQLEVVKAHLRLAQFRAMSSSSPFGINFDSSTTYYLFQGIGSNTPVLLPGKNNTTVDLNNVNETSDINRRIKSDLRITSAPQVITFNAYGSPGAANITVTTNTGNITITKNTGFIP